MYLHLWTVCFMSMSMIFTHVCGAPQAVLLHQDSWALGPYDSRPWTIPRWAGGPAVPLPVVPLPKGPEPEMCPHAAKSTRGVTPTCLGALRPWPAWPNTAAQSGGPDRNSPGVRQCRALPVTRSVLLVQIFHCETVHNYAFSLHSLDYLWEYASFQGTTGTLGFPFCIICLLKREQRIVCDRWFLQSCKQSSVLWSFERTNFGASWACLLSRMEII